MIEALPFAVVLLVAVVLADRQVSRLFANKSDVKIDQRLALLEQQVKMLQGQYNNVAVEIGMRIDDRVKRRA